MSLDQTIVSAIAMAEKALGSLEVTITLSKQTYSYDIASATNVAQISNTDVKGVITSWNSKEIEALNTQVGDVRVIAFVSDQTPAITSGDKVLVGGDAYEVVRVMYTVLPDSATGGLRRVLADLQLRA